MQKLVFTIDINAPKEKTWSTMLDDKTFRLWSDAFMAGSHYVGDWNEGSKILFLAPDESGKVSGMVSRIKQNRRYEYVSIEHLGLVQDGKEDTTSDAVRGWAGAHENYTLREKNGGTELVVEMDSDDEYAAMFKETWPKALEKLKALAEA